MSFRLFLSLNSDERGTTPRFPDLDPGTMGGFNSLYDGEGGRDSQIGGRNRPGGLLPFASDSLLSSHRLHSQHQDVRPGGGY